MIVMQRKHCSVAKCLQQKPAGNRFTVEKNHNSTCINAKYTLTDVIPPD
jgi:hypothetical protein